MKISILLDFSLYDIPLAYLFLPYSIFSYDFMHDYDMYINHNRVTFPPGNLSWGVGRGQKNWIFSDFATDRPEYAVPMSHIVTQG